MGSPGFSEFTFGYAVVREIEDLLGGRTVAPSFPTQRAEATEGYDVKLMAQGVPLFIQFKRSEVMRRNTCREFRNEMAHLPPPIFRMHLNSKNKFNQHTRMRMLEQQGQMAIYCTSAVEDKTALDICYANRRVFDAAAAFSPLEINLPSKMGEHHVSFAVGSRQAFVYSKTGKAFRRKYRSFDDVLSQLRAQKVVSETEQIASFTAIDKQFNLGEDIIPARRYRYTAGQSQREADISAHSDADIAAQVRRIDSVVKRVAIQAFLQAEALLIFVSRKALDQ